MVVLVYKSTWNVDGRHQPRGGAESVSSLESPSTLFVRVLAHNSREIPLEVVRHATMTRDTS